MTTLPPIPAYDQLVTTRTAWHTLAEHVLAAARYRVTGHIGLRATPGGFGTPPFGDGDEIRVDGANLVVRPDGATTIHPITTVSAAAATVGIAPGAPSEVYSPATVLDPDATLAIDADAALALAAWFELGSSLLEELRSSATTDDAPSDVQLWPEHFDIGLELGREEQHQRATFGASPGDGPHPLPYLYVTRWPDVPDDPFWNGEAFAGASVGYAAMVEAADPAAVGRAFLAEARRVLTRHPG